ncbi:hypothetical protein SAMN05444158_6527 [Bradyrhizobium canariense]|uniref:Uncharacterized protein n=1 Tax=Bradyrhizobium canariense TaxID=255045 RepID=A0A1H2AW67_9BRAD|nr:hypothetical protein SAMN05444158_6527 [Bradyrhizobium canariense]
MFTTSVKKIERSRSKTAGLDHVAGPSANDLHVGEEVCCFILGDAHMRTKLCSQCPYAPRDLAGHCYSEGVLHVCAKCDGPGASTHHPRKVHRRQQCATALNIPGTAQPSVAQSATESLALYATTAGERPSVRRGASTASRRARKATADGCVDFTQPDNGCGNTSRATWHMPDRPRVSCCDDADCYPTEIRYVDGNIYVNRREDRKYILVPPEKVERHRNYSNGRNHLCPPQPLGPHPSGTALFFALGGST